MRAELIAILAVPLVAAALSLLGRRRLAQVATLAGGLAALALAIDLALAVRHGAVISVGGGWLRLDALGAVFALATGFIYAVAAAYSIGYVPPGDRGFLRRYETELNLFAWAMLLVPAMGDFATMWIAIELTTIVSALMVALERTDAALEAAWKYVLIASCGLGIALLAVILLYASGVHAFGSAYVPRFATFLDAGHGALAGGTVKLSFLLAAIGFGTKVGFFPVHTWLPDAHSEAPTPVSAMLSGALLVTAFYGILRFFQVTVAIGAGAYAEDVLIVLGLLSLALAGVFVLRQESYKRLLAYSSIEHMGVIAVGIGFGAPLAVFGALLHVIVHAATKGLAFLGAGSVLRRYEVREIDGVRGAARALPWSAPMFLVAVLALSGLPVSGIFRSEFAVVTGGFQGSGFAGAAILIVLVNLAFMGLVWHAGRMVLTRPDDPPAPRGGEVSRWMVGAMVACLLVAIGLGFHVPDALSALLHGAGRELMQART
jgi:hydrogenase-4 component F